MLTAAIVVLAATILLATLRKRHRFYQLHRGSVGQFDYDAFICYATSSDSDPSDDDPEENFVLKLMDSLQSDGDIRDDNGIRQMRAKTQVI